MKLRTCKGCDRQLPLEEYPSAGKYGRAHKCSPCLNDQRRMNIPLRPIAVDPAQVRINNTFNLWHGPVSRVPLRSAA